MNTIRIALTSEEYLYLSSISQIPFLTQEEEKDLTERMHRGDINARTKIIESHLRMVPKYALKYCRLGTPFFDLIQAGNLGLVEAAEKYNCDFKARFSTYALFWIRRNIFRAVWHPASSIEIAVSDAERASGIQKSAEEIVERKELYHIVKELIESKLTEQEQRIVKKFYIDQLTLRKIGESEGLKAANVYYIVQKSIHKLSCAKEIAALKQNHYAAFSP